MKENKKVYNKSNTLCVRLSRKELEKLEYLKNKYINELNYSF